MLHDEVADQKWQILFPVTEGRYRYREHVEPIEKVSPKLALVDEGIENVVVLTGDIHSSWASEVPIDIESYDPETSAGSTVVEFVTPAVSSPGASFLESLVGSNPNIKLLEGSSNGYMIIDVTSDRVQADWYWCSQEQSSVPGETLEYGVSYAVASGTATMSEVSGPAPRVSEAPRLAPGSTDRAGG